MCRPTPTPEGRPRTEYGMRADASNYFSTNRVMFSSETAAEKGVTQPAGSSTLSSVGSACHAGASDEGKDEQA